MKTPASPGLRRLYRWWYACLAAGFFLLGINAWVRGGSPLLRWLIAAGFAALAWLEWRRPAR